MKLIFMANLLATLFMTGVIWIVQVVHYPLFSRVSDDLFRNYIADHNVLITYVVLPPMLIEAGTALLLIWERPSQMSLPLALTGLILVGIIWFSTFFLQVPQHNILMRGFDENAYRLLVETNWVRTFGWSMRSLLMLWVVWRMVG